MKAIRLTPFLFLVACQSQPNFLQLQNAFPGRGTPFQQSRFQRFQAQEADFQATSYQELILSHPSVKKIHTALDQHFRNTQVVGLRYIARFGNHYYVETILQTQSGSRFENSAVVELSGEKITGYDESVTKEQLDIRPLVFQPVTSLPQGVEQQLKDKLEREWNARVLGIQHIGQLKEQPVYRLKTIIQAQSSPIGIESELEIRLNESQLESVFER